MSATKNHLITFTLLMGLLLVGLIFVNGCKKEEPEPAATMTESDMSMAAEETQKESDMTAMAKKAEDMAKETKEKASEEMEEMKTVTLAMEQEKCPVMGQPINKELFTEYKGKGGRKC